MQKYADTDDTITGFGHFFLTELAKDLKKRGYNQGVYNNIESIYDILNLSIAYCSNLFESIVTNFLVCFNDVELFIHIYSEFKNVKNNKMIGFRQTCRYILSLLPILRLTSLQNDKKDEENIDELCKLIALNNLLQQFNQARAIQIMNEMCCLRIEITTIVKIEYTDNKIIQLNSLVAATHDLIHKNYLPEDITIDLMHLLDRLSPTMKIILDYTSQYIFETSTIIEVTREVNTTTDDIVKGFSFDVENVNLLESIKNPYDTNLRTRFRPILYLNIDGSKRAFISPWMVYEALHEISTNLLPYNELPKEWKGYYQLKDFSKNVSAKQGDNFEEEIYSYLKNDYNLVKKNITGFNNVSLKKQKVQGTNRKVGEIDFLLIDIYSKTIFIIEAKCTKTKYFLQSLAKDKSTFEEYSIKLTDKLNWISSNKDIVAKFFKLSNLSDFSVDAFFVSNSLVFYNFFSEYPIIPLDNMHLYLSTKNRFCMLQ